MSTDKLSAGSGPPRPSPSPSESPACGLDPGHGIQSMEKGSNSESDSSFGTAPPASPGPPGQPASFGVATDSDRDSELDSESHAESDSEILPMNST